ncbi:hypothetical protein, unlikely [Trypanosoma brucei gambiense DAL972]|uniref:Uncharacterized protein n=1 Tax=Trypanosoma brucei gambiense (strain MHOM/CI/86/DAL972) TaxID=679716 RepID=D0A9Y2_TRYB9|nr:hypothetical protein, unlikely [Trypanosoma brucei gambiense DAL972]CBH18483.1 hypothetical protein, unlikely [Trypanosoma brucei gambiense DAL972]|eukprot:XP_011780747.1 hypothetical protein, unlikely [Trypanosoma brucei gambiense DAL972]
MATEASTRKSCTRNFWYERDVQFYSSRFLFSTQDGKRGKKTSLPAPSIEIIPHFPSASLFFSRCLSFSQHLTHTHIHVSIFFFSTTPLNGYNNVTTAPTVIYINILEGGIQH